jgi:hypothetical protein
VKKDKRPTLHKIKTVGAETDSADLRESREKEDEKCMCVNHSDAQTPIKASAHTGLFYCLAVFTNMQYRVDFSKLHRRMNSMPPALPLILTVCPHDAHGRLIKPALTDHHDYACAQLTHTTDARSAIAHPTSPKLRCVTGLFKLNYWRRRPE